MHLYVKFLSSSQEYDICNMPTAPRNHFAGLLTFSVSNTQKLCGLRTNLYFMTN